MYFNTPSNNYFQPSAYYAPQQMLSSFQDAPSAFPAVEKNYSANEDNHSLQQLQQDGEDLFFNQQELPNHIEDSYFGSHISYDHFHDQDDEDFHGLFALELANQASQQLIWNTPLQQQQNSTLNNVQNASTSLNNNNIIINSSSNSYNSNNYQNNSINNNSQILISQSPVVPKISQNYQFNHIQLQNNIYSQQQQQKQFQNYQQQQQQSQQIGNAGVAPTVQIFSNSYSGNSKQISQQCYNSSSSSTSTFSSQSYSTVFSQQKSVQYVAPSPVNYYKLYENNNLVNQQNQVKGNNGNQRQNVQQTSSYMTCQQGQSKSMFQANTYQSQQQTLYENQTYQQQIPLFTQQLSSEECSYGDQQASSILNFTENCCDETTSDMHFNDDHHTLPIYGYDQQQFNPAENFDFFGHQNEEQQQVIQDQQPEQKEQQSQQQFEQIISDNKFSQMNNNIASISSSHTLPISPCEEQKHCSEDEEHEFSHHDHQDDEEYEEEAGSNIISMNILPENPEFYSQQRKDQVTEAMQKSNKKNVVRNLMRAFKQYFLNRKTGEQIVKLFFPNQNAKDVQQKFKRYFSQRKFNHNSIKQLVQHEKYGVVFHQFLKEHSQSYLKNSSVKMQELHQVFIDFLLLCFKDIELLDHLETYSKIKNPFQ